MAFWQLVDPTGSMPSPNKLVGDLNMRIVMWDVDRGTRTGRPDKWTRGGTGEPERLSGVCFAPTNPRFGQDYKNKTLK
jgi:hypothetical protein